MEHIMDNNFSWPGHGKTYIQVLPMPIVNALYSMIDDAFEMYSMCNEHSICISIGLDYNLYNIWSVKFKIFNPDAFRVFDADVTVKPIEDRLLQITGNIPAYEDMEPYSLKMKESDFSSALTFLQDSQINDKNG